MFLIIALKDTTLPTELKEISTNTEVVMNLLRFQYNHSQQIGTIRTAIFIRPDSELIRESVCACAKLFVDEGNVHMAQVES